MKENDHLLLIAVYVDDLLVCGSTVKMNSDFKREMSANFEMGDLGLLTYYLGIEFSQHKEGITFKTREIHKEDLVTNWYGWLQYNTYTDGIWIEAIKFFQRTGRG